MHQFGRIVLIPVTGPETNVGAVREPPLQIVAWRNQARVILTRMRSAVKALTAERR